MISKTIFRAYDVRGTYPTEIDEEAAYLIGRAFATIFGGPVVVGGDARLSTPSLKKSLIKGLVDSGIDVIDIGMVPTPVVYFACYKLGYGYGIVVTGSHLTKEQNGFKFSNKNGIPISFDEGLHKIMELVETKNFKESAVVGHVKKADVRGEYAKFMKSLFSTSLKGIKIIVDGANGAAGELYSKILGQCGAEVIELYCEPDGNFPNHTPDPMEKSFIIDLERKVKETGANAGIAFDGDGDRINVVDENGNIVNANHSFSMIIEDTLKENKGGKIVHDVLCSKLIDDVTKEFGGTPITWKVGHTYIAQKCFDEGALLAGEVSGHYFFKEASYADDVLIAGLKILKIMKNSGKNLSELSKKYPHYHSFGDRLLVKEEEKFNFVEQLKDKLASQGFEMSYSIVYENWEDASSIRKTIESLLYYRQQPHTKYGGGDKYVGFDLMGHLIGDVLYARWAGLDFLYEEGEPEITEEKMCKLLKRLNLPDSRNSMLVDERKSGHKDLEASIEVKGISLTPRRITPLMRPTKSWEDGTYYSVTLRNLSEAGGSETERLRTIDNIDIYCQCPRSAKQIMCRAPADVRKLWDDDRSPSSIPSPYVVPIHAHSVIASNHATLEYGRYNMEMYGYPRNVVKVERTLIDTLLKLDVRKKWPIFRLNWAFQDFGLQIFGPLQKIAKYGMWKQNNL